MAAAWLWGTPPALASATTSSNWAGYAAHGGGVRFRSVSARWRVPMGDCSSGAPGYSSVWVGLGGYNKTSNALEQTGTELDCTRSGTAVYSAWYELVPAPAHSIPLPVRGGDLIRASVSVSGHRVTLALEDLTDRKTFRRTFYASQLHTSSADWIVEAPSGCDEAGNCFTLPLADFGIATFSAARATTGRGHTGSVISRWWATTAITLEPHGSRSFADTADGAGGEASPSALNAAGTGFSVTYSGTSPASGGNGPPGPFFSGQLVHPPR